MKVLLVGNPNVGKTTFFNNITKSNERTGNWHGITVDEKVKNIKYNGKEFEISDLPGIYSVKPLSFEEEVATNILHNFNGNIINILDCNNLKRNLYLTLELIEKDYDFIIALNFYNEFIKKGNKINIELLSKMLGRECYISDGKKEKETKNLLKYIGKKDKVKELNYLNIIPFDKIKKFLSKYKFNFNENIKSVCIDIYSRNKEIYDKLNLNEAQKRELDSIISQNSSEILITERRKFIENIVSSCVSYSDKSSVYGICKLDKIILNKFLAFPVFILIMGVIFYLTFFLIGPFLSDLLNKGFSYIFEPLSNFLSKGLNNNWLSKLIVDGAISGFITVINFLPQIVLLFFFLSILEDSGYLSRLAFSMEELFNKVGLSGKSIFTILMGFGCITSAVFTTKNMEDENAKIKASIMTPYLCCSAKIPIFAVICGAFFLNLNVFLITLMYLISLFSCLIVGAILEKTILKSEKQDFILEFPPYRFPKLKKLFVNLWDNIKSFVLRVGSIIVCFNIVVWVLQNFSFTFNYIPSSQNKKSMLQILGGFIAPIFKPLGFNNYGAASALIVGIMAKEVIISSIGIINGVSIENASSISKSLLDPSSPVFFTPASAISFMVFSLLYFPCISTISVMRREIGKKWTYFALLFEFVFAYIFSYITYKIVQLIFDFSIINFVNLISFVIFLLLSIIVINSIYKNIKDKNCGNCKNCNHSRFCKKIEKEK